MRGEPPLLPLTEPRDGPRNRGTVDHCFDSTLSLSDPILESALAASKAAGLPEIQVAPNQGRLLHTLARMSGARRILKIPRVSRHGVTGR